MVECGICFAEYRDGELEQHRELCVLPLMFRCTLCNVDFVNKGGLWNHLNLHGIVDESKELHYQEIKAKHKLYQCDLCNDQRAYSETLYWSHAHEVHDGFFLRCSECGENFRSEKQKNDHERIYCKIRNQTVASEFDELEIDQVPIKVENVASDRDEKVYKNNMLDSSASLEMNKCPEKLNEPRRSKRQRSVNLNAVYDYDNSMVKKSTADKHVRKVAKFSSTRGAKCPHCEKLYATVTIMRSHIRSCHKPFVCDVCGITKYGAGAARNHKINKHTTPSYECGKCSRKFKFRNQYNRHLSACDTGSDFLSLQMRHPLAKNITNEENGNRSCPSHNPSGDEASCTECSHCGIKESNAVTLVRHILTHHEPVACDMCGITSPSLLQAQDHKKKMHKKSKNKCPHCLTYSWGGKQFERHVLKCKISRIPCELCGKMFATMCAISAHKKYCRAKRVQNDRINAGKERRQENDKTSLAKNFHRSQGQIADVHNETDSSTVLEKIALSQTGLSESKCYYCNEDFPAPGYLNHHLKLHHELGKCDICGITILGISSRKYHKVLCHTKPKFVCPTCGRDFFHKAKYNSHWQNCELKKYTCDVCGHRFKKIYSMRQHRKQEHPESIPLEKTTISTQDDAGHSISNPSLEKNANDHDDICSSRRSSTQERNSNNYEEFESLLDSRRNEPSLASVNDDDDTDSLLDENGDFEGQLSTKKISQSPVEVASAQQYQCSICKMNFTEFPQIRQHMLIAHTDGKFKCQHCSKRLRSIKELEDHTLVCADRKISCEFCSQKFKAIWGLRKHMKLRHHDNPMVDNTTNFTEEPNSDSVEEIDFGKPSEENLPSSDKNVNPSSKSAHAKCPYCVKSFSTEALRSRHIDQCHEPIACDICGLTFSNISKAKYHKINIHLKHEKFECPYCPMKYRVVERYEQHLSTCKSKEFPCDLCGKKYIAMRFLVKHKAMSHKGKKASKKAQHLRIKDSAIKHHTQTEKTGLETKDIAEEPYSNSMAVCIIGGKKCDDKTLVSKHVKATHQMTICIICRKTFPSADELMEHKLTCPQPALKNEDSYGESSTSESHDNGVKEGMSLTANIELEMEIKVEDTMLQEQEHQVPNEDQRQPCTSTAVNTDQLKLFKYPNGSKSKHVDTENTGLADGIKIKEECLNEEDNSIGATSIMESAECHAVTRRKRMCTSDRSEALVYHEPDHEAGDQDDQCYML